MIKDITSCCGYQQFTAAASTGLTVPTVDNNGSVVVPTHAVIIVESQGVRWRDDGIAPTAAIGMPLPPNSVFIYDGDLKKIRFIQQVATATINVSYYK